MSFEFSTTYALDWTPKQLKLINLIRVNPIIYALDKYSKNKRLRRKELDAWRDISKIIGLTRWDCCKDKWEKIKNQYGKLKCLIDSGKLPIELYKEYAIIRKYFNGSLSFLDPYLGDLSNPKMLKCFPTAKRFDNLVGRLCQVSYDQVYKLLRKDKTLRTNVEDLNCKDTEYVFSIIGAGVKESINALFFVEETEDIQNIETEVIESEETNIETCEDTIEKNQIVSDRESTDRNNLDNITDNLMEVKESDTFQNSSDNLIKIEVNEIKTLSSKENKSVKLVKKNTESGVSDAEMRKFFGELGYTMSKELSLDKQVKLQMQIRTLVKRATGKFNKPR